MLRLTAALLALVFLTGAAPPTAPDSTADRNAKLAKEGDQARRETVARDKRWDDRMKRTMGAICKGC